MPLFNLNLMDVLTLVAGILSIFFAIILQNCVTKVMTIDDHDAMTSKIVKGVLVSSMKKVDCDKLRSQLFQLCRENEVYRVRSIYQLFLDHCLEYKGEIARQKMKEYFENYLDSFLNDEEKIIEDLTRKNTQSNREYIKTDHLTRANVKLSIDDGDKRFCCYGAPPSPLSSPERKMRKQVQINPDPQIKLIEKRRKKKQKENVSDNQVEISELD